MRYSRQRELILSFLRADYSHPTAEDVYNTVVKEDPKISLGTVYRNLKQLADAGEIIKISTSGEKDRYDGHVEPHYHFRCRKCGYLYDIPAELTTEVQTLMEKIGAEKIIAEGLCPCCRRNS